MYMERLTSSRAYTVTAALHYTLHIAGPLCRGCITGICARQFQQPSSPLLSSKRDNRHDNKQTRVLAHTFVSSKLTEGLSLKPDMSC